MRRKILSLLVLAFLLTTALIPVMGAEETALYVDIKTGDDNNLGTISEPLQTIAAARDKVRSMKTEQQNGDITVYIREGLYTQEETLAFDERDSGLNGFDVVYKAYQQEDVVISGGKRIDGWEVYDAAKNIYRAPAQKIDTRGLSVNGVKVPRARSAGGLNNVVSDGGRFGMTTTDTYLAEWKNISDLEFVFKNNWFNSRCGVANVVLNGGILEIEMDQPGWRYITTRGSSPSKEPNYLENAYELLDEPGEWYLDKTEDCFYYMPQPGEDMKTAEVYAWVLEELMTVKGSSLDKRVHNIRFEDLSFMHATWLRPSSASGLSDAQDNKMRNREGFYDRLTPGAIDIQLAYEIPFTGCEFSHLGSIGLRFSNGVQYSEITGNHFHHISGSALAIGEVSSDDPDTSHPPDERLYMLSNHVKNNYVHHVAQEFRSACGLSIGYVVDTEIMYNEIEELPYSGMTIGWGWGQYDNVLSGLKVTNNFIQKVMNEEIMDGGGIYTNGFASDSKGKNLIAENYIKDIYNDYACIYLDTGSSNYLVERNVIDNYLYPDSPTGQTARNWLLPGQTGTMGNDVHNHFTHNWVTQPANDYVYNMIQRNPTIILEDTILEPYCEWDDEALSVIAKAGMEPQWKARWGGIDKESLDKVVTRQDEIVIDVGESLAPEAFVLNTGGQKVQVELEMVSSNPAVAVIQDGAIHGKSLGVSTVTVMAKGGTPKRDITIFVGDTLDVADVPSLTSLQVYEGNRILFEPVVTTVLGKVETNADIVYTSSDESIAYVDESFYLNPVAPGQCIITLSATLDETTVSKEFVTEVLAAGTLSGETPKVMSIEGMIADEANWMTGGGETGNIQKNGDTMSVTTPGGGAKGWGQYIGQKYQNEIFNFNVKMDSNGGWPTIFLRGQEANAGPLSTSSGYLMVFNPGTIELQRFNKGERTVFYGNIGGFTSKSGDAVPNALTHNEEHAVQTGAINTDIGVVIFLRVDGEVVFWYLDSYEGAIKEPGYFGYIARADTIHFMPPKDKDFTFASLVTDAGGHSTLAGGLSDIEGHWAQAEINQLVQAGIFKGDDKGLFNPDNNITRAEFTAVILRVLGIDNGSCEGVFSDAPKTAWHAAYLETALANGLFSGAMLGENDEIYPDRMISREECAGILSLAMQKTGKTAEQTVSLAGYTDYAETDAAYSEAVAELVGAGILQGYSEALLGPKENLTRAEAATVITRLLNYIK